MTDIISLGQGLSSEEGCTPDVPGVSSALLQQLLRDAASREVATTAQELLSMVNEAAAAENDKVSLLTCEVRVPEMHFENVWEVAERDDD
jgi:hypothetical protein